MSKLSDLRLVFITAAPGESSAVAAAWAAAPPDRDFVLITLAPGIGLLQSGIGKVNGALAAARLLAQTSSELAAPAVGGRPTIVNLGICGSLPGPTPPPIGSIVIAQASVYADEGVLAPDGFRDMAAAGFPLGGVVKGHCQNPQAFAGSAIPVDAALVHRVRRAFERAGHTPLVGSIATVSTCSGTDVLAREIAARTGSIAEAMEGAAIAHTLLRWALADSPPTSPLAFLELRTVSNTTGDRHMQTWNLGDALRALTVAAKVLGEEFTLRPE